MLVFLGFAAYLPTTKHMHLVFAWPNIWLFRKERYGLPPRIDFEKTEKFGIDRVQELPWKSLLDSYACTECGRCNAVCPAHATGKPLQPMKVLHDLKVNLRDRNGTDILRFRDAKGRPLPEKAEEEAAFEPKTPLVSKPEIDREKPGAVRADGAYAAGRRAGPRGRALGLHDLRRLRPGLPGPDRLGARRPHRPAPEPRDDGVRVPAGGHDRLQGHGGAGQPLGRGPRTAAWSGRRGSTSRVMAELGGREVEYLLWVGCAGSTDPRARKTNQALVRILKAAKVDFAMLGVEEKCTGDPARRMGNEYLFAQLAQENIETFKQYKFRKILVTCPHCLNSLGKDYREFGTSYTVVHHSQLLAELLAAGRVPLDLAKGMEGLVTFHDPCYLGRYNDTVEPPREVLARLGAKTVEMEKSRKNGFCCGAGGGRIFLEETIGKRVNVERTEQALATGATDGRGGLPVLHDDDHGRHQGEERRGARCR